MIIFKKFYNFFYKTIIFEFLIFFFYKKNDPVQFSGQKIKNEKNQIFTIPDMRGVRVF